MRRRRAHDSSEDDVDCVVPAVSDLAGGDDSGDANRRSRLDMCWPYPTLSPALVPMVMKLLVDIADGLGSRLPRWR
jgi:hypothetical protein